MYLHQIIEDAKWETKKMRPISHLPSVKEYFANRDAILKSATQAVKIHCDDIDSVIRMNSGGIGKDIAFCTNSKYLKLPYPNMWIDYTKIPDLTMELEKTTTSETHSRTWVSSKRGAHVLYKGDGVWFISLFSYIDTHKRWSIGTYSYLTYIGDRAPVGKLQCGHRGHFALIPIGHNLPGGIITEAEALEQDNGDLSLVHTVVLLLNAKNVTTQEVIPNEQLNKKRIRDGKQPLFSYHTLAVNIGREKKRLDGIKGEPISHNRLHLCRGHFKEFKDKGLFGRYTGLWWWQPTVRGQNKGGIVHKDYAIITK